MRGHGLLVALLATACGRIGFSAQLGDAGDVDAADAPMPIVIASDDFARTVANGWGDAPIGGTWLVFNPSNAAVNVSSGATVTFNLAAAYFDSHVETIGAVDTETRYIVGFDRVPTSGWYRAFATLRWVPDTTYYTLVATFYPTGALELHVERTVSATRIVVGPPTTVLTGVSANERIVLSMRATGELPTNLCARAWREATPEPQACAIALQEATPVLQTAGTSYLAAENGGGEVPATITFAAFRFLQVGPR